MLTSLFPFFHGAAVQMRSAPHCWAGSPGLGAAGAAAFRAALCWDVYTARFGDAGFEWTDLQPCKHHSSWLHQPPWFPVIPIPAHMLGSTC